MPASIIVANWREKICSDFGLTALNSAGGGRALPVVVDARRSRCASRPRAQLLERGREVGGRDRAVELEALRVDRVVREDRHVLSSAGGFGRARPLEQGVQEQRVVPIAPKMLRRLRAEEGMGLIELLAAMVIMTIALLALLAGYGSAFVSSAAVSQKTTATSSRTPRWSSTGRCRTARSASTRTRSSDRRRHEPGLQRALHGRLGPRRRHRHERRAGAERHGQRRRDHGLLVRRSRHRPASPSRPSPVSTTTPTTSTRTSSTSRPSPRRRASAGRSAS